LIEIADAYTEDTLTHIDAELKRFKGDGINNQRNSPNTFHFNSLISGTEPLIQSKL
jgi:hypothetical protein